MIEYQEQLSARPHRAINLEAALETPFQNSKTYLNQTWEMLKQKSMDRERLRNIASTLCSTWSEEEYISNEYLWYEITLESEWKTQWFRNKSKWPPFLIDAN